VTRLQKYSLAVSLLALPAWFLVDFFVSQHTPIGKSGSSTGVNTVKAGTSRNEPKVHVHRKEATNISAGVKYAQMLSNPPVLPASRFSDYLNHDPSNPNAWRAVIDLTWDEQTLSDALSRFPNDPALRLRAILMAKSPEERSAAAADYAQRFPNESLGSYLLASSHLHAGRHTDALNEFKGGIHKSPPVILSKSDILNRRAALESVGFSSVEGGVAASRTKFDAEAFSSIVDIGMKLMSADDIPSDVRNECGASFSEHLAIAGNKTVANAMFTAKFQDNFLSGLPPDAEYGESQMTIAQKSQQIKSSIAELANIVENTGTLWTTATEQEASLWANTVLAEGEQVAYERWIAARRRTQQ
jgi:hypothetical protein